MGYAGSVSASDDGNSLLLPERVRLLHIGPPKTGTSSLQEAAHAARGALYEHGVHYPGVRKNHRRAIGAFLDHPDPHAGRFGRTSVLPGVTAAEAKQSAPKDEWTDLMSEVASEPDKRTFISHEFAAYASDEQAADFVQELDAERLHVAITLRPFADMLASSWAQGLRNGGSLAFDAWFADNFDTSERVIVAKRTRRERTLNLAGLVERWAELVKPENVTIVVADKANQQLLTTAFEQMLGVPPHTLKHDASNGQVTNRSLSFPETEYIRKVNQAIYDADSMSWPVYRETIRWGAITQILNQRSLAPSEPRVRLPQWAVDLCVETGKVYADRISASGVRVVGDLSMLHDAPPTAESAQAPSSEQIFDIAVNAMVGAVNGATKYEGKLAKQINRLQTSRDRKAADLKMMRKKLKQSEYATSGQPATQLHATKRPHGAAQTYTTRELVKALRIRLAHKFRTGRSMRLK